MSTNDSSTPKSQPTPGGSPKDFDRIADASEFESGIDYGSSITEDLDSAPASAASSSSAAATSKLDSAPEATATLTEPLGQQLNATSSGLPESSKDSKKDGEEVTDTPIARSVAEQRKLLRDAQARVQARDDALSGGSRGLAKTLQVLLAIFAPIVLLIAVIRVIASPVFLWVEYHAPWFPADQFGFSTADRMLYGSYGLDYLLNFAPASYLGDLTFPDGSPLFTAGEVSHMVDVKAVMIWTMVAGLILGIACIVFMIILNRISKGAIRRAFFAGSVWFLSLMILLAVLGALFWQEFFATFHALFFADGTWTFYTSDTLIRLYPNQFWVDAAIGVAAISLIVAIVTLVLTWPTKRRRMRSADAQLTMLASKSSWQDLVADTEQQIDFEEQPSSDKYLR